MLHGVVAILLTLRTFWALQVRAPNLLLNQGLFDFSYAAVL